jgi:CRP-like cAMP-binding protein
VTRDNRHGHRLRAFGVFRDWPRHDCFADVDRAVEAAERSLIADAPAADGVPLHASALLAGLPAPAQDAVAALMHTRTLAAGERLFAEGDAFDGLYVVLSGSLTVESRSGRRFVSVSPGGMLGETAMLDPGGRSAGALADVNTVLAQLSHQALQAIEQQDPALASALYRNIARHLAHRLRVATAGRR